MLDQRRIQTFGQNMDTCLLLLERTHQDLSKETGIPVSTLKNMHTGEIVLNVQELQTIADELNIPARHLTQTYPASERIKRLREALEAAGLFVSDATLPAPSKEPKLPPMVRRVPKSAILIVSGDTPRQTTPRPAPIPVVAPSTETKKQVSLLDLAVAYEEPTIPTPPTNAPKPTKTPKKVAQRKQPVTEEIDPAFVMSFGGIDYNLQDAILKRAIVDRIRYLKGSQAHNEIAAQLSQKRSGTWLTKLGGITPAEVVDIAGICDTSVKSLVTGEGIVSLAANEKATQWLERYLAETKNRDGTKDAIDEIIRRLEAWPPPLRHMIVKYLLEIG